MHDMVVKSVDVLGDAIMATRDEKGQIWAGVSYFCNALGMSKGQKDRQTANVQKDETLKRGCRKFEAGVFDPSNEAVGMRIDFVPLWLAKINITKTMLQDNPDLADKLLEYQLKAKDILAAAFMPKQENAGDVQGQIKLLAQGTTELYERVEGVESEVNTVKREIEALKDDLPLFPSEADEVKNAINKKVLTILGGKDSNAYHDRSLARKAFSDCYITVKHNFGNITTYKAIKRGQKSQALQIIAEYKPPLFLQEQIDEANAKQGLET